MKQDALLLSCGFLLVPPLVAQKPELLGTEKIARKGVWVMPGAGRVPRRGGGGRVTVWFEEQLLGDGKAYVRRSQEWAKRRRRELSAARIPTA